MALSAPYPPPPGPDLQAIFSSVDKDRSGQITANELQQALSNGSWAPFNLETVRMMVGIFDRDNNGQLSFEEFKSLWKYISDWTNTFKNHDKDGSGTIDVAELKQALINFGYRLSDAFVNLLVIKFDRSGRKQVLFDDFIQMCTTLQSLTSAFRFHDTDVDGWVNISYEQFLTMVFSLNLVPKEIPVAQPKAAVGFLKQ